MLAGVLILASTSPRRRELLRNAGIEFSVQSADVPEQAMAGESPVGYAQRLAREKAAAISRTAPDAWVLGADTIVVVETEILGKPQDPADAERMLRRLRGREHQVITAVCLQRSRDGKEFMGAESTRVFLAQIADEEVRDYVAGGEPMDKAGAYAIQGIASRWVYRIEGDYFNVVGLPMARVWQMLRQAGLATR